MYSLTLKSGTKQSNVIFKKVMVRLCYIFAVRKGFLCIGEDSVLKKKLLTGKGIQIYMELKGALL